MLNFEPPFAEEFLEPLGVTLENGYGSWSPKGERPVSAQAQDSSANAEDAAPRKRRKRRSPPKSVAHEARIAEYGKLVADRGWIFVPPTPEKSISSLFEHLTVKQIIGLGNKDRVALGA